MTALVLNNLLWTSAALLLVLALRVPVARLFGAGAAYALWLLPLFRLFLPPLPPLLAGGRDLASLLPPVAAMVPQGSAAAPLPPDGGPGQWVPILLALWAGGAAAFAFHQGHRYRRFLASLSLTSRSLGSHGGIPLVESGAVDGPLAVGLLDRRIVVPPDFSRRYTSPERRLALDHELHHHRHGDIWWNLAALAVLALNWFNPIAYLAFRAFRADQELACDAVVAGRATPEEQQHYARALIKSASRPGLIAACPLNHADQLKRRLKMINKHHKGPARRFAGTAAVGALIGTALALGSPGIAQEQRDGSGAQTSPTLKQVGFVMLRQGDGAPADRVLQLRRGADGTIALPENCAPEARIADVDQETDGSRHRVVLCTLAETTPAKRLEILRSARARMAENERLSDEQRQRMVAALDGEIARLEKEGDTNR